MASIYEGGAPADYRCARCGAHGVKLWRQWNTFVEHIRLRCVRCACGDLSPNSVDRAVPEKVGDDGKHEWRGMRIDQIGSLAPAVPDGDGSFWGYTSVPQAGADWWRRLPTHEVT